MKTQQVLNYKSIMISLNKLYKTTTILVIALILSVTSLTALIIPKAGATSLSNVVADSTFNVGGSGFTALSAGVIYKCARNFALQPDGKIVVVGGFTEYNGLTYNKIIRLNQNGTIDNTFNTGGSGFAPANIALISSLYIQSDGKILVTGLFSSYNGINKSNLLRLNADGSYDNTFNTGVIDGATSKVIVLSNNKILVGGGASYCGASGSGFSNVNGISKKRLVLLNNDGSIDNSFDIGTGFDSDVWDIKETPDGKILAGGDFTTYKGVSYNKVIRLNIDGSVDSSFNHAGIGFGNANYQGVTSILIQPDKKIIFGGAFTTFNGASQNRLVRLNSDGTKDASFDIGTGFNSVVRSTALQSDGKILVGGFFTTFNGASQNRLVRLNSDGTKDASFDIGTGFDSIVQSINYQPDGKILVAGGFSTYNGNPVSKYFTRLIITPDRDQDGTPDTQEDSSPNGGDANQDGTLDSLQTNVSSFTNPITNQPMAIEVDNTCTLSNITNTQSNTNSPDNGYIYPLGLYNFTASCGTVGHTTNFKAYYYNADITKNYTLRKYNPNTNTYTTIDIATFATETIANQPVLTATYQITDGSSLDTDNQANGTIVDPAGPALTNPIILTANPAALPTAPNTGTNNTQSLILTTLGLLTLITLATYTIYKTRNKTYRAK